MLNYRLINLINSYIANDTIDYDEFIVNINNVGLMYEIPTKIHLNEMYTVKVSLCAIDTVTKHEFYFDNKKIDSVRNNEAFIEVKAKPDSIGYQLLKGKVKFLTYNGEVRWIPWSKKVKISK